MGRERFSVDFVVMGRLRSSTSLGARVANLPGVVLQVGVPDNIPHGEKDRGKARGETEDNQGRAGERSARGRFEAPPEGHGNCQRDDRPERFVEMHWPTPQFDLSHVKTGALNDRIAD